MMVRYHRRRKMKKLVHNLLSLVVFYGFELPM